MPDAPIDNESVDSVICPHCGHDHGTDEWDDIRKYECESCKKEFLIEVEYSVSFSTYKPKEINNAP